MNRSIHYVVNPQGELLACSDDAWNDFARENDGYATLPFPQGYELVEYLAGEEMRKVAMDIMRHVLLSSDRVRIPFRCDGPRVIRHGMLDISPVVCAGVVLGLFFESRIVYERQRDYVAGCLRLRTSPGIGLPALSYCSQCSSVNATFFGSVWMDLDDYYGIGGFDEVRLIQTICERCVYDVRDRIWH